MNIENVDPSCKHEDLQIQNPRLESKREDRAILSPKSLASENINPNTEEVKSKTTELRSKPHKDQEGKLRPPRSTSSRNTKASTNLARSIPSRYNNSHLRRRSSSTSSLQRLQHQRNYQKVPTSTSDDASTNSMDSSSTSRSVRNARQNRLPNSTRQLRRTETKDVNNKRGRSSRSVTNSAPSTPTGHRSDDASVDSGSSSSSFQIVRSRRTCTNSSTRQPDRAKIPKVIHGRRGRSNIRMTNSAPSTPIGNKQELSGSGEMDDWTEQQRKAKMERDKRRLQQPMGDTDILLHELNRSYHRPEPGIMSNERPNRLSKTENIADSVHHAEESPDTLSITSSNKRKKAFTPVTTIKKMASGFYTSPKRSPQKIVTDMQSPMSYSKAVKMGGTPQFIRKLFDEKTKDMLKDLCGVDINTSESLNLARKMFAVGTGISNDEVKKVLNAKASNANKWELKKQLEDKNHTVKVLKATLNQMMKAKNKHISSTIEAEKTTKRCWARAVRVAKEYDWERQQLKESIKEKEVESAAMKEEMKDRIRELNLSQERVGSLESELAALHAKHNTLTQEHTDVSVELKVEKTNCQQAEKRIDVLQQELSTMEACKGEAVNQAKTFIMESVERDKDELREEVACLTNKLETWEEELGNIIGRKETGAKINDVKEEMDKLRNQVQNLESHLTLRDSELSRAMADVENAKESAASKDVALRDLMKGLGDIQQSSQAREDEANDLRKEAESKMTELEVALSDEKSKNVHLQHEKAMLEENGKNLEKEKTDGEEITNLLKDEVDKLKQDIISNSSQLQLEKELRVRSCQKEQEERNERIALSAQMVAMTKEHAEIEARLKESLASITRQFEEKLERKDKLFSERERELSELQEGIVRLETEIVSLKQTLNDEKTMVQAQSAEIISGLKGEVNVLKEQMRITVEKSVSADAASTEQVKALEADISEFHAERRRMHNLIQELRGNVRVFARVRPFLPGDCADDDAQPCVVPNGENSIRLLVGAPNDLQRHTFTFDRVFPPSTGQDAVFTEVSEFVQSALDGYSVCLFSYGQTGSGKTHTMQGSGSGQMRGIIPRSIEQVGQYKEKLERDRGWKYEMSVSFVEIYNETIRDLLREKENDEKKHEIKVNNQGRRYISDIKLVSLEPTDADAVECIMHLAGKRRSVGATDMNATSSRSHSIFTLHLTAIHPENGQELRGSLNLVDLAGSERLDRSNATGDRAKEAMSINKSLSCLSDVFLAIGKKASHIPFRNSKLTYLLQPALSGDGKSLMLVNLSPSETSSQESLCSLRFASQVNKCELGRVTSSVRALKSGSNSTKKSGSGLPGLPTPPGTPNSIQVSRSPNKRQNSNSSTSRNVRGRIRR